MKKFNGEELKEILQKKESLIDQKSLGYQAIDYYCNSDESESFGKEKSPDGSVPINIRISKKDIDLLDFLAEKTGNKRASILADIITSDIEDMFHCLGVAEKTHLAIMVDEEISKKNMTHIYKNKTWLLEASQPDEHAWDPSLQNAWNAMSKNLRKGD